MIGRKSLLVFLTLVATYAFQLVGMLFLTHYFPEDVYGSITYALSFVLMFSCLANLGFNAAHVKRISEGKELSDCVSTFIVVKLVLTFSMALTILASVFFFTNVLGEYLSPESLALIQVFVVYQVMYEIVNIAILTFNARMEMSKAYLVNLLDPIARIPLIAMLAIGGGDIYQIGMTYIVGSSLVLITGLFLLKREHIPLKKPTLLRSYFVFAAPMAPIAILDMVSNNFDKILIGAIGDTTSVAYYASAKYLLCALGAVGLAVSLNTFPSFSQACSAGNFSEVRRMARKAERYISILAVPMVVVLILFPTEVCIFLFGAKFSSAGEPLRYLSLATLIVVLNQVYLSQILGHNRPKTYFKIALLDFMVFLSLMLFLIPSEIFGIKAMNMSFVGAAVAAAVTSVLTLTVTRFLVGRLTGQGPNPRMLLHIGAAVATGLFLAVFSTYLEVHEIYGVVLYLVLSYTMFEALLYFMKELRKDDITYLMALFNVRELWYYVRAEMRGKK